MSVSAPLLNVLSHNLQFFVVRDSTPIDIALMLGALFLIPAIFAMAEWIVLNVFGRAVQSFVHLFFVLLFCCLFFLTLFSRRPATSGLFLALLAFCSAACAVVLYSTRSVRSLVSFLGPSLLVIPAAFLISYPSSRVPKTQSLTVSAPVPIVVLVLDELPLTTLLNKENQIDALNFPNLASFAGQSTWFRRATTVSDYTNFAVPAALTGRYPDPFKPGNLNSYPRNLFTMLQGSYQLKTYESDTRLCPQSPVIVRPKNFEKQVVTLFLDLSVIYLNILFPADLRGKIPSVTGDWGNFWIKQTEQNPLNGRSRIFRDFVSHIQPFDGKSRPVLYFLHVRLPHYPFEYLPSGIKYDSENDLIPFKNEMNQDIGSCALQYYRHRMQTMFADTLLGEFMDRLRRMDLYDRSLIVVMADHGVSFLPGEFWRLISSPTAFDLMHIPLLIKFPGQTTAVVTDRKAEIIDILPTIADVLKTGIPWKIDGQSLLRTPVVKQNHFLNGRKERFQSYPEQNDKLDQTVEFLNGLLEKYPNLRKEDVPWVGKNVDEIGVRGITNYAIRLNHPAAFQSVDPNSGFLPTFISGTVEGVSPPSGTRLLVAVNHIICGVTPVIVVSSGTGPITGLRVFVPESSFQKGKNAVEFFQIRNDTATSPARVAIASK